MFKKKNKKSKAVKSSCDNLKPLISKHDARKIKSAIKKTSSGKVVGARFRLRVPKSFKGFTIKYGKTIVNQLINYIAKHYGTDVADILRGPVTLREVCATLNVVIDFVNKKFVKCIPHLEEANLVAVWKTLTTIVEYLKQHFKAKKAAQAE